MNRTLSHIYFLCRNFDNEALKVIVSECQKQCERLGHQLVEIDNLIESSLPSLSPLSLLTTGLSYRRLVNTFLDTELSACRVIQSEKRLHKNLIIAFLGFLGGGFFVAILK